ncbi:MAG TPA: ECF-type sigma factor [Gemmatimonadaceae bacterium]|nr:ECF-type sigma factor [Gemmatimonadaceae bacterium]
MESELGALVQRADAAEAQAAERLFALLYHELHRLAEHHLRRQGRTLTLGSTTLVHEAYLNMAGRDSVAFPDRARFLAYASRAMRTLVIDYARSRRAQKRGRDLEITLVGDEPPTALAEQTAAELERLSDGLAELASLDPALASLVDLHFFCGLSFVEIAALRGVSDKTVQRDWRKARMLLQQSLLDDSVSS